MTQHPETGGLAPSSPRLLQGVRDALAEIAGRSEDEATRRALAAADVALNEVMLRENGRVYADVYAAIRDLIEEGMSLLPPEPALRDGLAALPRSIDAALRFDLQGTHLRALLRRAEHLVAAARGSRAPAVRGIVDRILAVERGLHDYGTTQAPKPVDLRAPAPPPLDRDRLQAYLRDRSPEYPDLSVTGFKQLIGGFQKTTILFETEDRARGRQSCVLRAEKGESLTDFGIGDIRDEFRHVGFVHRAGVPVAEPLWVEGDPGRLGRRFMVSAKVAGENYGSAITTNKVVTDQALRSFVETLAKIHRTPIDADLRASPLSRWLKPPTLADNTRAWAEAWRDQIFMGRANPSPILARIFTWLIDNVPPDEVPPRVLHVDYGPHNILLSGGEVSAVLDWESVRLGDPAEDLSYFMQCTAAQIDRRKAQAWYEDAAGWRISEYRLRYFDVLNMVKIIVGSLSAGALYEANAGAGIEWCLLAFKYVSSVAGTVNEKIALAESCGE